MERLALWDSWWAAGLSGGGVITRAIPCKMTILPLLAPSNWQAFVRVFVLNELSKIFENVIMIVF